ncbi:MAG: hypothetical protein IJU03_03055 [Thermoguttaceae bacterium]|nr:hypothetical protein [Thermoguttaceae bacterium]
MAKIFIVHPNGAKTLVTREQMVELALKGQITPESQLEVIGRVVPARKIKELNEIFAEKSLPSGSQPSAFDFGNASSAAQNDEAVPQFAPPEFDFDAPTSSVPTQANVAPPPSDPSPTMASRPNVPVPGFPNTNGAYRSVCEVDPRINSEYVKQVADARIAGIKRLFLLLLIFFYATWGLCLIGSAVIEYDQYLQKPEVNALNRVLEASNNPREEWEYESKNDDNADLFGLKEVFSGMEDFSELDQKEIAVRKRKLVRELFFDVGAICAGCSLLFILVNFVVLIFRGIVIQNAQNSVRREILLSMTRE